MGAKPFWKSKTFWFALASGAAGLAEGPLGVAIPSSIALPIVAVGTIALRFLTRQPITVRRRGDW